MNDWGAPLRHTLFWADNYFLRLFLTFWLHFNGIQRLYGLCVGHVAEHAHGTLLESFFQGVSPRVNSWNKKNIKTIALTKYRSIAAPAFQIQHTHCTSAVWSRSTIFKKSLLSLFFSHHVICQFSFSYKQATLTTFIFLSWDLHSYFLLIGGYFDLTAFCSFVRSSSRSSIAVRSASSIKKNYPSFRIMSEQEMHAAFTEHENGNL